MEVIPTPKKNRTLPSPANISDDKVREVINILNQAVEKLQDKDYTEDFLEFISTNKYEKIFENLVWAFIRKNFVQEQMVRDAAAETKDFQLASKKYYVMPSEVPRNRVLTIDLEAALEESVVANGLGNGYFKIIEIEGNKIQVIDGHNPAVSVAGYVREDNKFVPVDVDETATITNDIFVFLRLSDKKFTSVNLPAPEDTDFSGLKLLGRVDLTEEGALVITQEHVGIVDNNFASEPFDIMLTSENSVTIKGGSFGVDNAIESINDTPFTITATNPIYIQTGGTGSPSAINGATPGFDPLIARTIMGKVYFADSKITRIEQYKRGWFHCHTWGDCDA